MNSKTKEISGRDFFAEHYRSDLAAQARWLEYGAIDKANSVSLLMKRIGINAHNLLELGSGTGAVIAECARRRLASEYTAIDYSPEALGHLRATYPHINCLAADITADDFALGEHFDVVVLSHVLEHLEDPRAFLVAIRSRLQFKLLILEVPLEDLLMSRIKGLFRDRTKNLAGHVQFFSKRKVESLATAAGFEIKDLRWFVPRMSPESVRFVYNEDRASGIRRAYKLCTMSYLPALLSPLWKRIWYAHLALCCTVSPANRGDT